MSGGPLSDADERDLHRLNVQIQRLAFARQTLAPDEVCLNCGSRIYKFDGPQWVHGNGSRWCEPQQAQPMEGRTLAPWGADRESLALTLLWNLVDDEPCALDHDGDCQTHNAGQIVDGMWARCTVAIARDLVAVPDLYDPAPEADR